MENRRTYETVAVVIPCRNEKAYIGLCLDSLVACDFDKQKLEVYVCDGLSDDGTAAIVSDYSARYPFIHLLQNTARTTPHALNLGIRSSKTDVVIILGAHAAIAPDFVSRNIEVLNTHPDVGCAGGIIDNKYENRTSENIGLAMSSVFGVGNAHFRTGTKAGYVDTVAFGAYTREVFEKCGLFDDELVRNQDDEFNFRISTHGFKIFLDPAIRSDYYVRGNYRKLFRQYYQYGYWKVFVNRKHRVVTSARQLMPPVFVAGVLLGWIPALFFWWWILLWAGGVVFYKLAAFLFALRMNPPLSQVPAVMWSFFILHSSYGMGYLEGLFNFMLLRRTPRSSGSKLSR
jgi:glycosyltransferase involved in cell wall biosynthesis